MHQAAYDFVGSVVGDRPDGLVVEIGGRNINGTIRLLFGEPYLSVDIAPGPGVDVLASGATFSPETAPACVVCCEVLEHTDDAEAICRNAYRMLQPGGLFIVTAAGEGRDAHSAYDGGPLRMGEFYRNVTVTQLCEWLNDFPIVKVTVNPDAGDIYACARKAVA